MGSLTLAAIAFAVVFTGGAIGLELQRALPENYTTGGPKDMTGAVVGMMTLLLALVLGLLIWTAYGVFSTQKAAVQSVGLARGGGSPNQSPAPGFGEKYWNLSGFPSQSLKSGGGGFFTVMFGQTIAYSAFSRNHFSRAGSVSGLIASTGHSGTQTPQSMHSSGWMTSMFSPS